MNAIIVEFQSVLLDGIYIIEFKNKKTESFNLYITAIRVYESILTSIKAYALVYLRIYVFEAWMKAPLRRWQKVVWWDQKKFVNSNIWNRYNAFQSDKFQLMRLVEFEILQYIYTYQPKVWSSSSRFTPIGGANKQCQ